MESFDDAQIASFVASPPPGWRGGQQVWRYMIGDVLARGATGVVYCAEDTALHRSVALKRVERGDRGQLVREARALAQLQHPNVVAIYEVVDTGDATFIAMELVDGITLTAWLRERARSWREILDVAIQAGRGLAAAHARRIVHGDFNPDHILIDADRRTRVAGFGLAPTENLPEGTRLDLYAFATTVREALHGVRAPVRVDRCVRRGPALDRAQRWRTVADFVAALERARRPRHRTLAVAAIAALVVGTVVRIATAGAAAPDTCASGAELVASVWNPTARISLDRSLTAATATRGHADAVATADVIDQWSGSWQVARRAACSAGPRRAAAIACLDRHLDELRAQLAIWLHASAADAAKASRAASHLTPPDDCRTASALTLPAELVMARATQVKVLAQSGHKQAAAGLLPALVRDGEAVGDHTALAHALFEAAHVDYQLENMDVAATLSARAAAEASKVGDDALMYLALYTQALAWIESDRAPDALGIIDAAAALAERGLPRPWLAHTGRAGALIRIGRVPEALAEQETAVAMCAAAAVTDVSVRPDLAEAMSNLGALYIGAGDWKHAIATADRAMPLLVAEYGPDDSHVAETFFERAQAEGALGNYAAALGAARHARGVLAAVYGEHNIKVVECDLSIARYQALSGDVAQARAVLERMQDELAGKLPPDHQVFAMLEDTFAGIENNTKHCAAAIPHLEREAAIYRASHSGGNNLAGTEVNLATCSQEVGQRAAAKAHAEAALAELDRVGASDADRAMAWAVLAEVAHASGDRTGALALARKAVAATPESYAPGDGHDIRVEIARWERGQ